MGNDLIFDAISGVEADWRDRKLNVPLRYFEAENLAVSFRAPVAAIQALLPTNVYPLRWGRQWAVTAIVFNNFPKSDIGSYQEIMIGFPVSVGEKAMPYLALRAFAKRGGAIFVQEMALDDQTAIDLGVEIAGYPKHLAELKIDLESPTLECVWREDGRDVLKLTAPRPAPKPVDKRDRLDLVTTKGGYVLRSESIGYVGRAADIDAAGIHLEFGAHERAADIRKLTRGKCLGGRLTLDRQLALSQPLEAWA